MFFLPKLPDTSDLRGHAFILISQKKMCLPNLLTTKTLQKHSSAMEICVLRKLCVCLVQVQPGQTCPKHMSNNYLFSIINT